LLNEAAMRQKR